MHASNDVSASPQHEPRGAHILGGRSEPSGPGPEVMAAATLEGDVVLNSQGDELGKVSDIMIDVRSGQVAYAVLSFGGVLGVGSKLFAIPWSALTLDAGRRCFILHVERKRLEAAPGFDKDHWPATADEEWSTERPAYRSVQPYWRRQSTSRSAPEREGDNP